MAEKYKDPGSTGASMSDERTPLIATVRVGEPRQRYTHNILRRFCTIALTSCLLGVFISFIVLAFVDPPRHHHRQHHHPKGGWEGPVAKVHNGHFTHEDLLDTLFETPSASLAEEWSKYYSAGPHLAGKNLSQVELPSPIGCE